VCVVIHYIVKDSIRFDSIGSPTSHMPKQNDHKPGPLVWWKGGPEQPATQKKTTIFGRHQKDPKGVQRQNPKLTEAHELILIQKINFATIHSFVPCKVLHYSTGASWTRRDLALSETIYCNFFSQPAIYIARFVVEIGTTII